jgi:transcriptional regulator with XRE-family HTH domain
MLFDAILCIPMQKTMTRKRAIHDLERLRREKGLTQAELASQLGVSQPHLSRVISGKVIPGNKLGFRIASLLSGTPSKITDEWLDQVSEAARRSSSFRVLVNSALEILKRR